MKKILFVVMLTISSMLSFAEVIVTTNGERIEDVSIQNETESAIVYLLDGIEKSIAIEQVVAILYDDGNYKEFCQNTFSGTSKAEEYIISLDSATIELQKLRMNPALMMKLLSDQNFVKALEKIGFKQELEYQNVLYVEISKGTPKKQAKNIAKQARDSIATIELLKYIRQNPIGNK